jgi:hypothetical protein
MAAAPLRVSPRAFGVFDTFFNQGFRLVSLTSSRRVLGDDFWLFSVVARLLPFVRPQPLDD